MKKQINEIDMKELEELIESREKSIDRALKGWKRTLDSWRFCNFIDLILMALWFVAGVLAGLTISQI